MNLTLKVCTIVLLAVVLVSGCNKAEDPYAQYTAEREAGLISDWLAAMVSNDKDIDTTSTGIYYILEKDSVGATVVTGDTVTVKYTGMFMDGAIFDASTSFTFTHKDTDLDKRMIKGWEEGMEVLSIGDKAAFLIPSEKAYGSTGYYTIPPYSPLIFVIEVVDIK